MFEAYNFYKDVDTDRSRSCGTLKLPYFIANSLLINYLQLYYLFIFFIIIDIVNYADLAVRAVL